MAEWTPRPVFMRCPQCPGPATQRLASADLSEALQGTPAQLDGGWLGDKGNAALAWPALCGQVWLSGGRWEPRHRDGSSLQPRPGTGEALLPPCGRSRRCTVATGGSGGGPRWESCLPARRCPVLLGREGTGALSSVVMLGSYSWEGYPKFMCTLVVAHACPCSVAKQLKPVSKPGSRADRTPLSRSTTGGQHPGPTSPAALTCTPCLQHLLLECRVPWSLMGNPVNRGLAQRGHAPLGHQPLGCYCPLGSDHTCTISGAWPLCT